MPLNLNGPWPPEICVPEFWPAGEPAYRKLLAACRHATPHTIGRSAGGRELWGLVYCQNSDRPTLCVCGGMHGHEAQGPATCFNLISILETGQDLKGRRWPDIGAVNYAIIPVINPDARARMPNAFVGLSVQDIRNYDSGLLLSGERNSSRGDVKPAEVLILGGLFNDQGADIIKHADGGADTPPELRAVLNFVAEVRPQVCLELHAHGAAPQFYCPLAPLPAEIQAREIELTEAIIAAGHEAGLGFAPNTGEVPGLSTALYYQAGGAVPLLFESPQGAVDAGPRWTHEQIIDVNLFVIARLTSMLSEEEGAARET